MTKLKSIFADAYNLFHSDGSLFNNPEVDSDGFCSVSLEMRRDEVVLAHGTGFFWDAGQGEIAIVTAWHNLSGLHHSKRTTLHSMGGMPNSVTLRFTTLAPQAFRIETLPLYLDEAEEQPRWFVHKRLGNYLDIAFLLLKVDKPEAFARTNIKFKEPKTRPKLGEDVFAIGFPQNAAVASVFPVWKRGSIASDMDIPVEGHPKFMIDMTGRSGMSGSPVFRIKRGMYYEGDSKNGKLLIGDLKEFVGIYSGRAFVCEKESSELGFVWRREYIDEMINHKVLDEKPEPGKGTWTHSSNLITENSKG
ncbi:S1 family peptidase [Maricaulis sp.]|uniref:S1 family peptidase n=1 Tax=Maricaulis sp. TaxID=1486257 RepID=UPI003A8CFB03